MKQHTTNYINTFIEVADDCPIACGEITLARASGKTLAELQYELISKHPYKYTSDDVLFQVYALRNNLTNAELKDARVQFFSKGQACFRASPLTKRYGFGLHSDSKAKVAIYSRASKEYEQFVQDASITKVKAMRTSKK